MCTRRKIQPKANKQNKRERREEKKKNEKKRKLNRFCSHSQVYKRTSDETPIDCVRRDDQ